MTAIATEPQTDLYFEAHVTVEPVSDHRFKEFEALCKPHQFRVAELFMRKRKDGNLLRSPYDSFCTGRSGNYSDLYTRMQQVVKACQEAGIKVWRYKIENTLLDVRISNESGL